MFIWISSVAYIALFGIAIGGMLINKRTIINSIQIVLIGIVFASLVYFGMTLGNWFFSFLPFRLVEIFIAFVLLSFLILAVMSHQPNIGFFHEQSRGILFMVAAGLFLIIGIEWTTLGLPLYFTIIAALIFLVMVFLGATLQMNILKKAWKVSGVTLVPMLWILVIIVLKLF